VSSGRSAVPIFVISALLGACGSRSMADCLGNRCAGTPDFQVPESEPPDEVFSPDEVLEPPVEVLAPTPSRPEQVPSDTPIDRPLEEPPSQALCEPGGTFPGSIAVSTQEQLEGLADCAQVDGDLTVSVVGSSLEPLLALQRVTGTLSIDGASTLDALSSLSSVGSLVLERVAGSLAGLSRLRNIRGFGRGMLAISSMPTLRNLQGLESLETLTTIRIEGNPVLFGLDGLRVPADLDALRVVGNPSLSSIGALGTLVSAQAIEISGNAIPNLNGLGSLREVESLALLNDSALTDTSQLGQLQSVGVLHLENLGLTTLTLPSGFLTLGTATIQNNPNLVDVDALGPLFGLTKLSVINNPSLLRLPAFVVTEVEQVYVRENLLLASGPGFPSAVSIDALRISRNPSLTHLLGFANLATTRTIDISENAALIELNLGALTAARRISITCNTNLPEDSLEPLRSLDGTVQIGGNLGSGAPCL
jgi:hypothetical protein